MNKSIISSLSLFSLILIFTTSCAHYSTDKEVRFDSKNQKVSFKIHEENIEFKYDEQFRAPSSVVSNDNQNIKEVKEINQKGFSKERLLKTIYFYDLLALNEVNSQSPFICPSFHQDLIQFKERLKKEKVKLNHHIKTRTKDMYLQKELKEFCENGYTKDFYRLYNLMVIQDELGTEKELLVQAFFKQPIIQRSLVYNYAPSSYLSSYSIINHSTLWTNLLNAKRTYRASSSKIGNLGPQEVEYQQKQKEAEQNKHSDQPLHSYQARPYSFYSSPHRVRSSY